MLKVNHKHLPSHIINIKSSHVKVTGPPCTSQEALLPACLPARQVGLALAHPQELPSTALSSLEQLAIPT